VSPDSVLAMPVLAWSSPERCGVGILGCRSTGRYSHGVEGGRGVEGGGGQAWGDMLRGLGRGVCWIGCDVSCWNERGVNTTE
jgi:hypothetical protein